MILKSYVATFLYLQKIYFIIGYKSFHFFRKCKHICKTLRTIPVFFSVIYTYSDYRMQSICFSEFSQKLIYRIFSSSPVFFLNFIILFHIE